MGYIILYNCQDFVRLYWRWFSSLMYASFFYHAYNSKEEISLWDPSSLINCSYFAKCFGHGSWLYYLCANNLSAHASFWYPNFYLLVRHREISSVRLGEPTWKVLQAWPSPAGCRARGTPTRTISCLQGVVPVAHPRARYSVRVGDPRARARG